MVKRLKPPPRLTVVMYRGIKLPGRQYETWAEDGRYREMREAG
jgi:hypothetical protein